jgi:broad specificity phosphatase PhoE
MSFNAIYSSGLKRAQETAEEYVKKTGMNLIVDYRLDEIDWVHWHKIKYFNMTEQTRKKNLASHRILDKQLDKMQIVARRTLADICRSHRGKKIIIFTHGNFIRALITGILNADIIGFLSLEIFQSSVSKFIVDSDGYVKISFVNDASHLPMIPLKDYFITLAD